ncbi:mucin-2-like isoform X2 [Etheostoma cragini]|uniref:mucin-2-like isoform X2 n=1 Tax=Etheostoma cragini TaxID=417921 RepID=UPI00155F010C|nr:mucin-2-like isoform X2 [Etheostoma cragini]
MEYHSGGSLPLLGRPRYCPGANANGGYLCETGHCCGETGCCTYYYELWWFWLLWTVLILFSCCCAYRHRRAKLRVQQQQRQREISLLAYHGASSYPSSMLDLSFLASLKLPSYEEVAAQPSTPPPPYSSVFTTPRYPQPPRTADPHLLTQHDPLLHRPLSTGPSSLSSDNSSSCSCDSCCPSSPCSSSLSPPVTYETDTSHATTPGEATPLTFDVTLETISAAATCLAVHDTRLVSERIVGTVAVDIGDEDANGAQEPDSADSPVPNQAVTVAVVTRAASPQPLPSPGTEVAFSVLTTSPMKQQLDPAPCAPLVTPITLPSPNVVETTPPSIQTISIEDPVAGTDTTPAPKIPSMSGPPTPTVLTADSPTETRTLDLTRTFDAATLSSSPTSLLSPDDRRTLTLITSSVSLPTSDPNPSLVPIPAPSTLTQAVAPVPSSLIQVPEQLPSNITQVPDPILTNLAQTPVPVSSDIIQVPDPVEVMDQILTPLTQTLDLVPTNLTLVPNLQPKIVLDCDTNLFVTSAHSDLILATDAPTLAPRLVPTSPRSDLPQHPGSVAGLESFLDPATVPADSGPSLALSQLSESVGSRSGPLSIPAPVLTFPTNTSSSSPSSCPAITIDSEFSYTSPAAHSPSSTPSLPSPSSLPTFPALSSTSLPAPALLLDPLSALQQPNKGGSSSGHASSLSPSPRATQSPPKQTLFSPCVDIFEPGPPSWEDGEEEQEEEDNDDDEDEDMGADESQYRHRRLTGDSGIEVCRCRVEDEDEEEEEEERNRKEDGRRERGGERDTKGGGNPDLHDSVDCPARGQVPTGEGLILCNSTPTPTTEDSGKIIIAMETV